MEGKFGNVKRKGKLQRIMAKLSHTSESVIYVGSVVLNLEKWQREEALSRFLCIILMVYQRGVEKLYKVVIGGGNCSFLPTLPFQY